MIRNLLRVLIRLSIQLSLNSHFTNMVDIHVVFVAHVGDTLEYREIMRSFLIKHNCHRVTERLYEEAVRYAPGSITWLSMDLLVSTPDDAEHCFANPLLTPVFVMYAERLFKTYREAMINDKTTFAHEHLLDNVMVVMNDGDKLINLYLLVIPLWVVRPRKTLISRAPTWRLSVHAFSGLKSDYRKLALSISTGDNYRLVIQKLCQELINGLAMSRWTSHISKIGMIEFHSRSALFLIPDDMISESDFDTISLLTRG
jgi:hypothetical protein